MHFGTVDHVRQTVAVLGKQSAQLGFKFNFFIEARIAFQRFKSLKLFGEVFSSWRNSASLDMIVL